MVKISLIMPVYNAENYIKQSVVNVLNQSFDDFELICVDDNSNDNSLKILLEYALKDNRIIVKQDKKNLMQSLIESITEAAGEYILFVNCYNLLEEDFLESINEKIMENPVDLLIIKSNFLEEEKDNVQKFLALRQNETFSITQISELIFELEPSLYNKLYNKEFLLDNEILSNDESINYCEILFYKALLEAKKISYYDKQAYSTSNHITKNKDINNFIKYLKTQDSIQNLFIEKYHKQAFNNKIKNTINQYNKINLDDKKRAYELLRDYYLLILNQTDAYDLINLLTDENHKNFEQIIISETLEEYELLKKVHQDKKIINFNKRYEKILKSEHKKIKRFNDSLISSKSWKLTRIFRIR